MINEPDSSLPSYALPTPDPLPAPAYSDQTSTSTSQTTTHQQPLARSTKATFSCAEFSVTFDAPGDSKSVWLTSSGAGLNGAVLSGEIKLAPGTKVKEVVVTLDGVIEYHRNDIRRAPTAEDLSLDKAAYHQIQYTRCVSWRFHQQRQSLTPSSPSPSASLPFSLSLPSTYPSEVWPGQPLPPSCAMANHGVRYFLKIKVVHPSSGLFNTQKKAERVYVPVIYAPLHSLERLPGPRLLARATASSVPPPGTTKELWAHSETSGSGGWRINVWLGKPALYVRAESIEFYVRLDGPAEGAGFPRENLVAELRVSQEWIHLDDDILSSATLTPIDPSLLPPLADRSHRAACFKGLIEIPATACPSFRVRQLQQTHSLRVTFTPPAGASSSRASEQGAGEAIVVKVPLILLNVSNEVPYLIGGKYCNADAVGGMLAMGKAPIERM